MKAYSCALAVVVLLVAVVAVACGNDEEAGRQTSGPVSFVVCDSSETWMRPSEEAQSERVWYGDRYYGGADWDLEQLQAAFREDFVHWHGGASESLDLSLQHGLWSTQDRSSGGQGCDGGDAVSRGEVISVYLLLHEAKGVELSDSTYWITVEETPTGFQEIQFTNLLYPEPDYTVVIVDTQGKELARAESGGAFEETAQDEAQTATPTPEGTETAEP
jgi:hypothetical protein